MLDSVQYTKNDWRNRNRLLTPSGEPTWLTVPVITANRLYQKICDAEVRDHHWVKKHEMTCHQFLNKRPFFNKYWDDWENSFANCKNSMRLATVNEIWRNQILHQLNIETQIIKDSSFELLPDDKNLRVLKICTLLNADEYITGPVADRYLDYELFFKNGIKIKVMDYSRYPAYIQSNNFKRHDVSVLDWISSVSVQEQMELLEIQPIVSRLTH